jgi:hypothetical protein
MLTIRNKVNDALSTVNGFIKTNKPWLLPFLREKPRHSWRGWISQAPKAPLINQVCLVLDFGTFSVRFIL